MVFDNRLNQNTDHSNGTDDANVDRDVEVDIDKAENAPNGIETEDYIFYSEITEEEVKKAVLKLKKGKSPGPNGFSRQF